MTRWAVVLVTTVVFSVSASGPVFAASIRNAYFSNGELVRGQYYKSEGQLPGATKEFTKGNWRQFNYGFNLGRLEPGTYQLDLVVDDHAEGPYGFTLK